MASCLALLVTSLSFGIRAGIMGPLAAEFNLTASHLALSLRDAKNLAGPEVLQTTLIIPLFLVLAFGGLVLYMRSGKRLSA